MISTENRSKRRAAALSVGSNTVLVLAKLVVGILTRSVAVISEAIHSAMDLLAAIIAFVAVSFSDRPPDRDHPHGHGKIESLSGAVEALLIFGAVLFIAYESINKLIHGGQVQQIYLGSAVMGLSALVNAFVSWHLQRVGKRTDSEALLADAAHLRTDVYTSLGVLVGLLLVHFTHLQWLDPATALTVGLLIVWEAWTITRRSVGNLLDESLPPGEHQLVEEILTQTGVRYHDLRTRKSGAARKIDLHLEVSPLATVEGVHALCDRVEEAIQQQLPRAQVLIHPEPDLEDDVSRDLQAWIERILEGHNQLFRAYSDLHLFEGSDGVHVVLRLELDGHRSLEEVDRLCQHLTGHILQHMPGAMVFIQPHVLQRPAPPLAS